MFGKDVVQNKIVSGMRQGIISTPGTYTNTISIGCSKVSFREDVEGTYKTIYSKTCVKWPLSIQPKIGFQDQLSLNVGQKYCRMLQGEHSAILSTFIKLPFIIKIYALSFFEWPFYTGFTVT